MKTATVECVKCPKFNTLFFEVFSVNALWFYTTTQHRIMHNDKWGHN